MKREKGFSLIELALAILITGLLALAVFYFSGGYWRSGKTEQIVRWFSDLKSAVNKYSTDAQSTVSSLSSLSPYLVIPNEVQVMNPQWQSSATVNCDGGVPVNTFTGYAVSLSCGDMCQALRDRLKSLGWCVSLSGQTLTVAVR
ncbi:MAG: prepilin-type N-terminal cleavage/methylation domain-containing protein [Nitrososphaerales archaeon]